VENTLSEHPAISLLALIGEDNQDRPGSEIVKAYIQLDPDYRVDGDEDTLRNDIIAFAKEHCAPYEVPKIIEFIDEVPLTAVGKIDKKVLRSKI
jgi:long-chain acyl-CoA synthetase